MGKREIALILAFLLVGFAVYQLTAPPPKEGEEGFSLPRLIQEIKNDLAGQRYTSEVRSETTAPVPADVVEIEIAPFRGKLVVIGEPGDEVAALLVASVSGTARDESDRHAKEVVPRIVQVGELLRVDIQAPRQVGRMRSELTLRVPGRLRVRAEVQSGATEISRVAAAFVRTRGELTVTAVEGAITGEHREGDSTLTKIGSARLVLLRSDATIAGVSGDVEIEATDGDIEIAEVSGRTHLRGVRADMTVKHPSGPVEISAVDGRVSLDGTRGPVRIEGTRARLEVHMASAATVHLSTTDDPIELSIPPAAGVTVNAIAADGKIETDLPIPVVTEDAMQRASGPLNGGGAAVTLRTTRGTIAIGGAAAAPAVEK